MLLKDVKAGTVYAVLSWGRLRNRELADFDGRDFEDVGEKAMPALAVGVGVEVPGYARPGVLLRFLDRETMEPLPPHKREAEQGAEFREQAVRAVNIVCEFERLREAYNEWLDDLAQRQAEEAERRVREQQRRQEEAAARWRQHEFAVATRHIEQVSEVLGNELPTGTRREAAIRTLVELRNPDGNPYENGTRKA